MSMPDRSVAEASLTVLPAGRGEFVVPVFNVLRRPVLD